MQEVSTNLAKARIYAADLPWNVMRPEQLGPAILQFVKDYEPYFRRWAEKWFENFQFVYGNQSVRWSKRWGFAVDVDYLRRVPSINMRAQTNISRVVLEALASMIFAQLPEWEVEAADESSIKGARIQKIISKLLDAYMIRLNCQQEFYDAAMIFTAFGQFGAHIDWDPNAGQLLEIPQYRRIKTPVFTSTLMPNQITGGLMQVPVQARDAAGMPMFEDGFEAVVDAMGRQVLDRIFAGDVRLDIMTPFEYRREPGSTGMHNTRWIQRFRLLDYDQYMDEYEHVEGKTKAYNSIRPIYADPTIYSFAIQHYMRMQFTAPPTLQDAFRRNESIFSSRMFRSKVFVIEHWDRPHLRKWPIGRRVVITNGEATHVTTPSYSINTRDGWHPFVEAQWMRVKPSSIAAGPMNDVIQKNRELNIKDSLIATAVRRNMGSTLLTKVGMGIDPQKLTGEPGGVHEVLDPMAARWLHDDMPIPTVLPMLRQADRDDTWEMSGAGDALRGQPSVGSGSGYQEKQREEREEKRLTPAKRQFEAGISSMGMKIYACLKANVKRLDDQVVGYLKRAAAGEYEIQDVIAVLTTPVDYGVDVNVRKSSMAVKSKASQQATMMEFLGGIGAPLAQDPQVMDTVLKFFDLEKLRSPGISVHADRSSRENEVFEDMLRLGPNLEGIQRPVVCLIDRDEIHLAHHENWLAANFDRLRGNEMVLFEVLAHIEQHKLNQAEKMGMMMPGTSLLAPQLMAGMVGMPGPAIPQVAQYTFMQQQAAAQGPPGSPQAPQAPGTPKAPGTPPGAKPTDPAAPSGNTPPAARQGAAA